MANNSGGQDLCKSQGKSGNKALSTVALAILRLRNPTQADKVHSKAEMTSRSDLEPSVRVPASPTPKTKPPSRFLELRQEKDRERRLKLKTKPAIKALPKALSSSPLIHFPKSKDGVHKPVFQVPVAFSHRRLRCIYPRTVNFKAEEEYEPIPRKQLPAAFHVKFLAKLQFINDKSLFRALKATKTNPNDIIECIECLQTCQLLICLANLPTSARVSARSEACGEHLERQLELLIMQVLACGGGDAEVGAADDGDAGDDDAEDVDAGAGDAWDAIDRPQVPCCSSAIPDFL